LLAIQKGSLHEFLFVLLSSHQYLEENLSLMGDSFENVPQLHRLSQNGMKLSAFVGLEPVSIDVGPKNFQSLAKGSR
jgi:hypothetical protein